MKDAVKREFAGLLNNYKTIPISLGNDVVIGGKEIVMMAGPCSVESYEQTDAVAKTIADNGGKILRGGAFKPRTSPGKFQGLGEEGLIILREIADELDMLVVTEALGVENLSLVAKYTDIIQIGSRNMQHYPLLWEVGKLDLPVLLKRGFMSTIDEWMAAADHVAQYGNEKIIFCERGIRGFDKNTRNTFDTSGIALLKQQSKYPVIGDPSHATGRRDLVIPAARAAIAAGADGLLIEAHPNPSAALSDNDQQIVLEEIPVLFEQVGNIAAAIGR
jgi:3-deoxy-7-phosphoheptulonate synthase